MSPEPDLVFPTLTLSPRATPERDMSSRQCSPELERSPSPSPVPGEEWPARSRSSSPEVAMHPQSSSTMLRDMSTSSSVMSFDMVNSYQSLAPADIMRAERKKQQEQQTRAAQEKMAPPAKTYGSPFKPNAGLSKPITPSFIRDYDRDKNRPGEEPQRRHSTSRQQSQSPYASGYFQNMTASAQGRLQPPNSRQMSAEPEDDRLDMVIKYRHGGDTIASDPTASSQSGMASFFEQLDKDMQAKGWQYGKLLHHSVLLPTPAAAPEPERASLSAVYLNEVSSQVDSVLRHFKTPVVTLGLVTVLAFVLYLCNTGFGILSPDVALSGNSTAWGSVDFPTLMNIESAFERVVDSSAGGSELARSLKNSEMAVSDLSTVVRHSDLKCRKTLSTRLERFADDARFNVLGLLSFASEVGGVLDQLLSVNQYALRELTLLHHASTTRPSLLSRLLFPQRPHRRRLADVFDTAVEVLESNLRVLIAEGSNIESALDALALQHKPIHDEIIREFSDLRKAESLAMSSLWSRFAAGSRGRANFKQNERLLSEIHTYQDKARGYVETTLLELRRMTAELDQLRRRVAEPLLVGGGGGGGGGEIGVHAREGGVEVGVQVDAVRTAVDALVRKRANREERLRQWNRLILEREMKESIEGGGGRRT
ncbi:hypothetical protein EDC01DRAFT_610228 [Geopyxis carbonaria]|nr:hypothetical protein EDC01DRAFT_610228 [Geopyxis carbonaria]